MSQWLHPSADDAVAAGPQVAAFRQRCTELAGTDLTPAEALHWWSVQNFREFWGTFLDWADLAWEGRADVVCTSDDVESASFFPGVRLNYAENLLRPLPGVDDDSPALTAVHGDGTADRLSRAELRDRVRATATALAAAGVCIGDRVVVIAPNNAHAAVTVLAVAALGATVSTGMPDMGPTALLGRFEQVEPLVLVLDRTGSGEWDGRAGDTLRTLLDGLPTVRRVLFLDAAPLPELGGVPVARLDAETGQPDGDAAPWPRLPFNHPLFVMFSSGTTGPPKAMVHGAGGTLLEHVKEHRLHGDLGPADTMYFHTTTAWMMWNWQLSALSVGAHIVVYDGAISGPETLWRLVAAHGATVFGTSPTYLQLCQDAGYRPADDVDLGRLRAVMSTGAVLHDWQFDWLADAVGPVPLQSISGGTDLIGCFVLGHPELPVQRGRCQTRTLGLDVAAVDEDGGELVGRVGDLVCRNPFPSRPVCFLRDPDGRRFHEAYFAEHPGMWTHGDLIDIAADGSARLHGRSDGVLNIDGVRIGPSEIYTVLRELSEIADAMAVEQRDPDAPGLTRLVLLAVLRDGAVLDAELARRIRTRLRRQASAAHVPSLILGVDELPLTHNGKRSERAARDTLNGDPVVNLNALKNPGALAGIAAALVEATAVDGTLPAVGGDETATAVGRLWREALGPAADADRTFSDLGGTSRQAMTLVRQVRVTLGRDVAMEDFLADPTLRGLTAATRRAARADDAAPVVRLADGDPAAPPLFFVHDAWGDVDVYWPLAQLLTDTGPVHGLRVPLENPDGSPRSVVELAAAGTAELQRTAPTGTLRLAGYSFGGLVAYEMARQLTAAGREVDFLGLFDVLPPAAGLRLADRAVAAVINRVVLLNPTMRDERLRDLLAARFRPTVLPPDGRLFVRSNRIYNAYRPGPYAGPVTYFRARRRVPVVQHLMHVWRALAPRLTVAEIPGAHHDLLGQANVAEAARACSAALAGIAGTEVDAPCGEGSGRPDARRRQ